MSPLSAFDRQKYLTLETYRKSGVGVCTPVWFATPATGEAKLYIYTSADSGKVARVRRSGAAKIAPCDARGKPIGPWINAHAQIVDDAEFRFGMGLLDRKYWPWKRVLDLFIMLFPRHSRVMIAITPA